MTFNQNDNQSTINNQKYDFLVWKSYLNGIFQDVFETTIDNLPDMPYWDMYQENVEQNLIVLRMFKILENLNS